MIALREGAKILEHEHFHSGILEVQSKKKNDQFVRAPPPPHPFPFSILLLWSPSLGTAR